MDQQVNLCLCVFMGFHVLTAGGAVPIPVERKGKDQGGSYEASI